MITYKDSGVNIKAGDDLSKYIYEQIKTTWKTEGDFKVKVPSDDFSGLRCVDISGLQNVVMGINFDGVGTKVEIAEMLGDFSTLGYDLMAMVCDDAIIRGAIPIIAGSIIDFKNIPDSCPDKLKDLIDGYVAAAKEAGVQIINGEVAELGNRIGGLGPLNLNWGAGVVWVAEKSKLISGKNIKVGDSIFLLQEKGFRSNGLSLVRKILKEKVGIFHSEEDRFLFLKSILTPSKIYTSVIKNLLGNLYDSKNESITGMAHITGGGLPGKIGRMLKPCGYGAELKYSFSPPEIMKELQNYGKVADREAYKTWNMGNGFAIVTNDPVNLSHALYAQDERFCYAGEIIEEPIIKISNNGVYGSGEILTFKLGDN